MAPQSDAEFEAPVRTALAMPEAGVAAALVREEAEIKAAVYLARQNPRDENTAFARVMKSCRRPSFAEGAQYRFPRGGQTVKGPSVQLARELARCWGNVRYGHRVVSIDADTIHIKGYAFDLETNAYVEQEDKFARLVPRKGPGGTKWVAPDERDLRELVNRRGAILVRNCLLQLLPPDLVEEAIREVESTLTAAAKGEIKQSRDETIRRLVVAFDLLGVTPEMLAAYLGHPLETITAEEIVDLRGVYTSIKEGNTKVQDHFDLNAGQRVQVSQDTQELNARLADAAPQPASAPTTAPPSAEPTTRPGPTKAATKAKTEGLL